MALITRKVCLVGDFGVGKTSLVRRFVSQTFEDKYITTVGVKVDSKSLELGPDLLLKLLIWDIAGQDTLTTVTRSYLQGAQGYLLVADGTRADTIESALRLRYQVQDSLGKVPAIGLMNKSDLKEEWKVDEETLKLESGGLDWCFTSALDGSGVDESFINIATALT